MDVEQLRAHLDDDERVAREANAGQPWECLESTWYTHPMLVSYSADGETYGVLGTLVDLAKEERDHIARQDPSRTLRWVAAARKVLDAYEIAVIAADTAEGTPLAGGARLRRNTLLFAVEAIASVYEESA